MKIVLEEESRFICSAIAEMAFCGEDEFGAEDPLFTTGIIDSAMLLDLVVLLEKKYQIRISSGELTLDNFNTVSGMIKLINKKHA